MDRRPSLLTTAFLLLALSIVSFTATRSQGIVGSTNFLRDVSP